MHYSITYMYKTASANDLEMQFLLLNMIDRHIEAVNSVFSGN